MMNKTYKIRSVRDVPFFPVIPFVPVALFVGTVITAIRALVKVRRLERQMAAPSPS